MPVVVGLFISELLLFVGSSWYALWGHVIVLSVCVFLSGYVGGVARAYRVLALLPVLRITDLGMPAFTEHAPLRLLVIYVTFIPAIYFMEQHYEEVRLPIGGRRSLMLVLPAAFCGVLCAELGYWLFSPPALVPDWSLQYVILGLLLVDVGFIEEVVFRGLIQDTLVPSVGKWSGIVLTSALFGVMHLSYNGLVGALFGTGLGLVLGLVYHTNRSLLVTMTVHGTMNFFLFVFVPLNGSILA